MPNNNNGRSGMGKNNNGNSNGAGGANGHHRRNVGQLLLAQRFPVNSLQEITLVSNEVVSGRVYCTDEISGTVVLQKALVHTTLAAELRLITATHISKSHVLPDDGADSSSSGTASATPVTPLSAPLPKIQKKALEERERRAIRLAEDSLRHINQSASSVGQTVFDCLLKACGDVNWAANSNSIVVLGTIQVDEPYQPENCCMISGRAYGGGSGKETLEVRSLERVKNIVAASQQNPGKS